VRSETAEVVFNGSRQPGTWTSARRGRDGATPVRQRLGNMQSPVYRIQSPLTNPNNQSIPPISAN
jgi:hypothetical protein